MKKETIKQAGLGLCSGILNGLFGAGGGMIAVPLLEKLGLSQKEAHATSIAIILPTSIISTVLYYLQGNINFSSAWIYLPFGLLGAILGAFLMKKISNTTLRLVFGIIIVAGAIRLLLK